jgi:predicted Zn finger-like uncharacterized protein
MTIQCDSCGKRFNASDALAGKRVRCRGCGQIITVPKLEEPIDDDIEDTRANAPVPARSPNRSQAGGRLNPIKEKTITPTDDSGYELDDDDGNARGRQNVRRNTLLPFPGSAIVDRLLPHFLLFLSLGWVTIEMLRNNEIGPMWVPIVRVGTFAIIYLIAVWPVTRYGSARGAEQAGVELPPNHAWRVLSTFAFPATLGYVLWSINGGLGSFVAGAVVGLVIALGAYYILFRLQPDEAAKAMPWVGGFYIASVVAGVAAFVGINFATMTILSAGRTAHLYRTSPLGQHLAWDPPVPPEDASQLALRPTPPLVRNKVTTGPSTMQSALDTGTPAPPTGITAPAIVQGNGKGPAGENVPPGTSQPVTNSSAVGTVVTVEPTGGSPLFGPDDTDDVTAGTTPAVTPQETGPTRPLTELGSFSSAIFPITPSHHVLVVRKRDTQDLVEVWDLSKNQKIGETGFQRDLTQSPDYALSPDGKWIVRLNAFPTLSVITWSVPDNRPGKVIVLNKNLGQPSIVGFADKSQVWLKWEKQDMGQLKAGLEGFDVSTTQVIKRVEILNYVQTAAGVAISPDGKLFAAVKTMKGPANHEVSITNLKTGQLFRRLPLVGVDARFVEGATGLAFSSDMSKLALVLESNNQGLLLDWQISTGVDSKPLHQHLFPGGFAGAGSDPMGGHRLRNEDGDRRKLEWLPDNSGWLVNGTGMYDANNGMLTHDLGVEGAVSQRVLDPSTIAIVARRELKDTPRLNNIPRQFDNEFELLVTDPAKLAKDPK